MKVAVFVAGAFLVVAGLFVFFGSGSLPGQGFGLLLEIAGVVVFGQIPRVGGPERPLTREQAEARRRRDAAAQAESADELTDEERLVEAVRAATEPEKK